MNPADVTVNVVTVHEPAGEIHNTISLNDDPTVKATQHASANLGATPIPGLLTRIMASD